MRYNTIATHGIVTNIKSLAKVLNFFFYDSMSAIGFIALQVWSDWHVILVKCWQIFPALAWQDSQYLSHTDAIKDIIHSG